jgi:hypothetical protein
MFVTLLLLLVVGQSAVPAAGVLFCFDLLLVLCCLAQMPARHGSSLPACLPACLLVFPVYEDCVPLAFYY